MRALLTSAATAVVLLAAAAPLCAETAGADAARTAFRALVEIEGQRPPSVNGTAEAMRANREAQDQWRVKYGEAGAKFRAAFAASDWAEWPVSDGDAPLLERGLLDLGESASAKGDGAVEVKAFERAATLPKPSDAAASRIAAGRPAAHFANRAFDRARELAADAAKKASKDDLPAAVTRQGDIECALGRDEEARAFYSAASAEAPDEDSAFGRDAIAAIEAKWKLDRLGDPLGDLAPEWCLGTADGKAPEFAGSVVVVAFPDPYSANRFDPAPYARLGAKGAVVFAVLTPVMTLCMGETLMDYPTDSAPRLRGEPQPDGLRGWAERLRRIAHVDFPVLGVPSAKLPRGKAVLGSALVVDKAGRIAYFRAPGEPSAYMAGAVERLVGAK